MAQIVFLPLPQMGHINPTIKLAKKLKQKGHQVSYLGPADLEEYISSQGLSFFPILTQSIPKGTLPRQARMKISSDEIWKEVLKNPGAELGSMFQAVRPDLLLIDVALRDLSFLARRAGIRCALISTSLDDSRLQLLPIPGDPADELPVITLCPLEFETPQGQGMKGHHYVEASVDLDREEAGDFPWERLDTERPLIFCTLGSHPEDYKQSWPFFRAVIDAMRQKPDWQLLLALGNPHVDPTEFQPVPPNVLLVSWAPQLAILKRASIMMTHGGLGTIKECIFFGVPMIVFPVAWDQPRNASRVVYHGLGVRGGIGEISTEQILHLIDRVADDPSFKENAQAMSKVFQEIEERGAGAEVIERILSSRASR
jgi:UDP:flavonoid glycosyltransferase YjiC (YdhE family)